MAPSSFNTHQNKTEHINITILNYNVSNKRYVHSELRTTSIIEFKLDVEI